MSTKFVIGNLKELSHPLLLLFCTESLIYTLKDRKDTNLRYCLKFVLVSLIMHDLHIHSLCL